MKSKSRRKRKELKRFKKFDHQVHHLREIARAGVDFPPPSP